MGHRMNDDISIIELGLELGDEARTNGIGAEESHRAVELNFELEKAFCPCPSGSETSETENARSLVCDGLHLDSLIGVEFPVEQGVAGDLGDATRGPEEPERDCKPDQRVDPVEAERPEDEREEDESVGKEITDVVEGVGFDGEGVGLAQHVSLIKNESGGGDERDEGDDYASGVALGRLSDNESEDGFARDDKGGDGDEGGLHEGGNGLGLASTEAEVFGRCAVRNAQADKDREGGKEVEAGVGKGAEHRGGAGQLPSDGFGGGEDKRYGESGERCSKGEAFGAAAFSPNHGKSLACFQAFNDARASDLLRV